MVRRTFSLILIFSFYTPALFATYSDRGVSNRSDYVHHKYSHLERTDPRMKYLQSRKSNSCTWSHGVCTTNAQSNQNKDGSQVIRYQNTLLEQEWARQKKLRPWL